MSIVIKFVSMDGLVRFEEKRGEIRFPEPVLRRNGTPPLRPKFYRTESEDAELVLVRVREYELFDRYIDPTNGRQTYEYRERPE